MKTKLIFERICDSYGFRVLHYHADNGLFDVNNFKEAHDTEKQTLSFCGVNSHHQNGKPENRIKDVTTGSNTPIFHASHHRPNTIHASLWTADIKNYANLRNSIPTNFKPKTYHGRNRESVTYDSSPLSRFSCSKVEADLDHFHTFEYPVYVLENYLQSGKSHNKWIYRSIFGIYLSHLPQHASNIPLLLNTKSGNVSPQCHCVYDNEFETCKRDAKFKSLWKHKYKRTEETVERYELDYLPTKPPDS